jgi:hypothetical protein
MARRAALRYRVHTVHVAPGFEMSDGVGQVAVGVTNGAGFYGRLRLAHRVERATRRRCVRASIGTEGPAVRKRPIGASCKRWNWCGRRGSRWRLGSACIAILAVLALPSAANADVSAVEGQPFSGTVVDIGNCALASADIYWGDGTPTSTGSSDGATGVQGTHTYADERNTTGNVSYTCTNIDGTQTADFQVVVHDAPLTSVAHDVSGTSGEPVTAAGHFDDANPAATAADFSAQIAWGDGDTSVASITSSAGGGFDVAARHTYDTAGSYTLSTTVVDVGGSTTSAASTARIAAPLVAGFTSNPSVPCRDEKVTFDGSPSSAGTVPITQYHWFFQDAKPVDLFGISPPENVTTTNPVYTQSFGQTASDGPKNIVVEGGFFGLLSEDFTLFRPPVSVTLTVTDELGRTALVSRQIVFADPQEIVKFSFPSTGGWASSSDDTACDTRVKTQPPGGYGAAKLPSFASLSSTSVTAQLPCGGLRSCVGVLEVHTAGHLRLGRAIGAKARIRIDPTLLGGTGFVIATGQTGTVKIKLNPRGKTLKRAGKLRKVTLTVTTFGAHGKTHTTSRPVALRTHR